jgi:hypothetical protein
VLSVLEDFNLGDASSPKSINKGCHRTIADTEDSALLTTDCGRNFRIHLTTTVSVI